MHDFVPFHTDPALNYYTGNGLVAQWLTDICDSQLPTGN